jgi:predicted RNA methylase
MRRPATAALVTAARAPASLVSVLKGRLVAPGARPRRVRMGMLRGLRMQLDLRHQTQLYLGLYEHELHRWLRDFSLGAVTALDIGAADGAYTLYFLTRTPASRVLAFEPDPVAREHLLANLRLNSVERDPRVEVSACRIAGAVGDGAVCLDALMGVIEPPAVVKVDVEGAELSVLDGASALLRRGGVSWIIETHSADLERDCIQVLEGCGLPVRVIAPAWWRMVVPETRPIAHNRWLVAGEMVRI